MSDRFRVTGLFYRERGYKLRSCLDIRRVGSRRRKPQLMLVMMNPGSSYPLDGNDDNPLPAITRPDATQHQVMKLMETASLDYARVINLSDLRTPDSTAFYRFLRSAESSDVNHSIFAASRRDQLNQLFVRSIPVVFGWGVNACLVPLAKQAMETLNVAKPLGLLKTGTRFSYYHPLPRVYAKQQEWIQEVAGQIKRFR